MSSPVVKVIIVSSYQTNCYVVSNPDTGRCVIVDPGDSPDKIEKYITDKNLTPEAVLITHGHDDHTGAQKAVEEHYGIKQELAEAFSLIGYDWKVIRTPGHTTDSVCFYIEEEKLLFSGDTLFRGTYGRYDFPGGSLEQLKDSILNKLFLLPDDVKALPGHAFPTTIGYEKERNMILYS